MSVEPPTDRRELLRNALGAIEQLKARIRSLESAAAAAAIAEPIAIVGAGCRFPGGASGLDAYWALLSEGRDVVAEIPASRWETVGQSGAESGWHAGLVDGIDRFDPRFFGISAREATTMDPQQRLVLEVAWEALEQAGVAPDRLGGSPTGVFLGITGHDYVDLLHEAGGLLDVYAATGNANNAAAGRLSFVLGLQGPSVAVDTACSSSLVAIHLACNALRAGDCRMALAGGVNALLSPAPFECFRNWGMMAPDGRCKTFDARADGFVRAEGAGMVVLKRLSDARADGDRVLAVIRGSAVNQDGRSSGLTVPNGPAQEAVIRRALEVARLDPLDVGYVEAHGTGTSLGDPIEAHALAAALGAGRAADNPLVLGSVKTNLGHLESAAGVAGLLKVVLSLQHERIPAHLHYESPNPDIDWGGVPVEIPVGGRAWPRGARRRVAGVSSFGFSGTNAHVVLEEAPADERPAAPDGPSPAEGERCLLTLSARTPTARDAIADRLAAALARADGPLADATLADVCHTANTGRAHLPHRAAVVAATRDELREKLSERRWADAQAKPGHRPRVAFLFTGQGSGWAGMGRELDAAAAPAFRATLDACAAVLDPLLGAPLRSLLWGPDAAQHLATTAVAQPALGALALALAAQWAAWGVRPAAVLGHSVGEYAALAVAGVWSLADTLGLLVARGRLMQALAPGWTMAAVAAPRAQVAAALAARPALAPWVSLAAENAPASTVLSGRAPELASLTEQLAAAGLRVQPLAVGHGFHSPQMDAVAEQFAALAVAVPASEPTVRVVSSVTGEFLTAATVRDLDYWRRQVREAVEFRAAMATLAAARFDTFLEVGPTATLVGLGRQCIDAPGQLWTPSLRPQVDAREQALESLGRLYVRGVDVDLAALDAGRAPRRVSLPTYPFERERHWIDGAPRATPRAAASAAGAHPLLGARFTVAGPPETHVWETELAIESFPWLADHCVGGDAIVPATAYIEMATAAARQVLGAEVVALTDARFHHPLRLADGVRAQVQVSLVPSTRAVRVHGRTDPAAPWTLIASTSVEPAELPTAAEPDAPAADPAAGRRLVDGEALYALLHERGNQWGPTFRGVARAWLGAEDGWAEVVVPEALTGDVARYRMHPAVSDAAGHVLTAITAADWSQGADGVAPMLLEVGEHGQLDSLRWVADAPMTPQAGEVAIRAEAIGLNFRDVLNALGMYPGDAGPLGGECAGVVTAVGEGVTDFRVGDEVLAFADRAFATSVVARAALTAHKPASMTFAEAATIPVAFLTAEYALRHLARLAPGDRVLVHAATGGVGMAATQLALAAGATVLGTAGTPEKRAIARAAGAAHVSDSRSLAFVDDVRAATDGEGVDVVLNSLAGDFIPASLGLLRAGGRFVEIGKTEIWDADAVARAFPGIGYEVLYLGEVAAREPALVQGMLRDLVARFEAGALTPLPQEVFAADRAVDAFRHMAQARHVGKVVVLAPPPRRAGAASAGRSFVGQSFERICVYDQPRGTRLRAHGWVTPSSDPATLRGDVRVFDEDGRLVSEARGVQMRALTVDAPASPILPAERWYHQLAWTEHAWSADAAPAASGPWMVVRDARASDAQATLADHLVAAMRGDGVDAMLVADDAPGALARAAGGRRPGGVVYLGGIDASATGSDAPARDTRVEALRRVASEVAGGGTGRLWAVTRGVHAVEGPAALASVWQAPLWGLGRALSVEHTTAWGGLVDLDASDDVTAIAASLWRHLREASDEDQVAVRGGRRYVARLESVAQPQARALPVHGDGAYLVTGGLGGLGLAVARWLADRGARHLLLWGRTALPDRAGWDALPPEHPQAPAVAALRALEADGVTVAATPVDVSDAAGVARALAAHEAAGGPAVRGVVHAAGVVAQRPLLELTAAEIDATLRPKLGAWALHEAFAARPLDFLVLFSSGSALRPPPGLGAYAAANAFLDALAHARRGTGAHALSVNWGAWGEAGMAARDGVAALGDDRGMGAMRTAEGLDALGRLLASPMTQAAVLPVSWPRVAERYASYVAAPMFASLVRRADADGTAPAGTLRDRLRATAPNRRRAALQEHVRALAVKVLGIPDAAALDVNEPLRQLGLDSLMAVELRNLLSAAAGRPVPATITFDHPTVAALTEYLAGDAFAEELAPPVATAAAAVRAPDVVPSPEPDASDVDELSDDDLALRLTERLNRITFLETP